MAHWTHLSCTYTSHVREAALTSTHQTTLISRVENLPQAERRSLSRSRKARVFFRFRSPQALHPPFKKISLLSSECRRLACYPCSLSAGGGSEASVSLAEVQPGARGQAGTCLVPRKASPPGNKARGPVVTAGRSSWLGNLRVQKHCLQVPGDPSMTLALLLWLGGARPQGHPTERQPAVSVQPQTESLPHPRQMCSNCLRFILTPLVNSPQRTLGRRWASSLLLSRRQHGRFVPRLQAPAPVLLLFSVYICTSQKGPSAQG